MNIVLPWLRHLLIVVPAIGSLGSDRIASHSVYTLLVLLALLIVRIRIQWPRFLPAVLFCGEVAFVGYLSYSFGGILFLCHLSALISIFERRPAGLTFPMPPWLAALLPAAAMNAALAGQPIQSPETFLLANVVFGSFGLLLYVIQTAAVQKSEVESLYDELSRNHLELQHARKRLMQYAKQVEEYAQLVERNRISKDIHDDLGHRLIRQKMMVEAILSIRAAEPEKAALMLEQVRDQMTESMDTLRRTVRNMSPETHASGRYSLEKLIESAGTQLGIDVRYRTEGLPYALYPSLEYILYRNAQEAITNAIRHGGATEVDIVLAYTPDHVAMSVSNNGSLPDPESKVRKGLGIRGMEERVSLVGGRVDLGGDGSFTVTTVLPHYRQDGREGGTA
ncbi:sensor histidine kinase [Paenibacillus sp. MSJ-34]|nr:sensor histidine kinase [Paenibacillus sp. MSJ-34]MBU5440583.1 sensor histidine kinase [Paenibacillus sp. MSJ-34]CAH0120049.1 hypothetical protein PAE9249_02562 [Paenibacillus sp. CECT 9249]